MKKNLQKLKKLFFISTAIPYVNSPPHLGFALEIIQADVLARYHRLFLKENVFFLTGTDENSLKNVKAAQEKGISVKELVDQNAQKFYQLKEILNLSFDDFIRTTEKRHLKGVQKLWLACQKDIYKKKYKGLYCLGCEEFYKEKELKNGLCPEHKKKPELIEEENYFFRLSKYQNRLKKIIAKDELKIVPKARKNEVLSFIKEGLEDICISRSAKRAKNWGIDVPGDKSQKIWVWMDALSNYINALGYGENEKKFEEFWQKNKNKVHIIGKGILRFHAVYWPALLLSAGLELPNIIFVHGYITSAGQKMSKSLGNIVDPFEIIKTTNADALRYFLLREIPSNEDGDFTFEKFKNRYNADLAKGLGNLVSRLLKLTLNKKMERSLHLFEEKEVQKRYSQFLENFEFNKALELIWQLIENLNKIIEKEKPWTLEGEKLKKFLNKLFGQLFFISHLLKPFLPETAQKIEKTIEEGKRKKIEEKPILFPKLN